jgi:beta-aspartyl-peptidase (threonine type)
MRSKPPVILIHGGAGGRTPEADVARRKQVMLEAVTAAAAVLARGSNALDAAVKAVVVLEDDPLFNAGYGSVLNRDGVVEMDASVMAADANLRAGAVAAVQGVRNPIMLARAVMERTSHVLIVGEGARRLAREVGLKRCRPQALISERAKLHWQAQTQQLLKTEATGGAPTRSGCGWLAPARSGHGVRTEPRGSLSGKLGMVKQGATVGAVALDKNGGLAAATSTGGIAGKLPGRVGDSAIIGAGTFADTGGAASATGTGEAILTVGLCREAVRALRTVSPSHAALRAIRGLAKATGAQAGIILLNRRGAYAYAHNAQAMDVACFDPINGARFFAVRPARF